MHLIRYTSLAPLVLLLCVPPFVHAEEATPAADGGFSGFFENLPGPVEEFISSTRAIGTKALGESNATSTGFQEFRIRGFFTNVNDWLTRTTGFTFSEIAKGILNILVWFLNLFVRLFNWILGFL